MASLSVEIRIVHIRKVEAKHWFCFIFLKHFLLTWKTFCYFQFWGNRISDGWLKCNSTKFSIFLTWHRPKIVLAANSLPVSFAHPLPSLKCNSVSCNIFASAVRNSKLECTQRGQHPGYINSYSTFVLESSGSEVVAIWRSDCYNFIIFAFIREGLKKRC